MSEFPSDEKLEAYLGGKPVTVEPQTQWVQHVSGQGPAFKVVKEWTTSYNARLESGDEVFLLPKGLLGYNPCPPPERWEVVKDAFTVTDEGKKVRRALWKGYIWLGQDERFVIRPDGALVVERKVER